MDHGSRTAVRSTDDAPRAKVPRAGSVRAALAVLRNFRRLAQVFKYSVNTDIPRDLLAGLIPLSGTVRQARISSIQFIPPLVSTAHPDYAKIRTPARAAITDSGRDKAHNGNLHGLHTTCA